MKVGSQGNLQHERHFNWTMVGNRSALEARICIALYCTSAYIRIII